MYTILTTVAAFAAAVSAYTSPDWTKAPSGNPIAHPGLHEVVTVNVPFTISWAPTAGTESSSVALVLCVGPSTNCVPQTTAIVEGITNSGSYVWTAPASLADSKGADGYGILLISSDGTYQYSTQFSISNAGGAVSSSSSSTAASSSPVPTSLPTSSPIKTLPPITSTITHSTTAKNCSCTAKGSSTLVTKPAASTGGFPTTVIQPTGGMTIPTTLRPTATILPGAAANVVVGGAKMVAVVGMGLLAAAL